MVEAFSGIRCNVNNHSAKRTILGVALLRKFNKIGPELISYVFKEN